MTVVVPSDGTDCAICSEGYTAQPGFVCNECSSSTAGVVLAVVLAVVALIVAVAVVSYATTGEGKGKGRGLVARVARYIPLQSVKIVIVAWQILTQVSLTRGTHGKTNLPFGNGMHKPGVGKAESVRTNAAGILPACRHQGQHVSLR